MFAEHNSKHDKLLHNVLHCVTLIVPMKIISLEWSDNDIEHIAYHGINPAEVESVCFDQHISIRGKFGRYILYGQNASGRHIKLVLERLYDHIYRPVTAYDMTVSEKHKYKLKKSW
jgi:uncharacterized DUF497 family protein